MSPPIGYESEVVNGQLVNVAPKAAYDPLIFGQMFATGGMWPRQGVYNVPPVLPSAEGQASMTPEAFGATGTYPFPSRRTLPASCLPVPQRTAGRGERCRHPVLATFRQWRTSDRKSEDHTQPLVRR